MAVANSSAENQGLRVVAYPGDQKILLAMSLPDNALNETNKNLAGFAIWRKSGNAAEEVLSNRISFDASVSPATAAGTPEWTPSDQAPFQKFRWIDVPPNGFDAPITYRVKALYFSGRSKSMTDGPQVSVTVAPAIPQHAKFRPAFTRGYIASQAYADKFKNADIRPSGPRTLDFNTAPYQAQYKWLGADARTALFNFIADCEASKQARVDVFAYDLDEPDVIAAICRIGKEGRLRAILDNAALHAKAGKSGPPPEVKAASLIKNAAGGSNVKQGHFDRYQHNKVFVKRDASGNAERVLFGSMNFSVRGIYVQANNVIVVDDPTVAGMFAKAFDVAFADNVAAPLFRQNQISQGYMVGSATNTPDLPRFSLALSPHTDWSVSLGPMTDRIRTATSSVLFAVMEPTGGGPVLASLREIAAQPTVFSYGTVETNTGLAVQSPNGAMGELTGFAALIKNVPAPFKQEISGGAGMHIHDKFVIVDFNAGNPTVFTGSSNLASGGETQNGDSLTMIEDDNVARLYAIEAVALFDHYHFRKATQSAQVKGQPQPLTLWYPGKVNAPVPWWKEYYDPTKIQLRDRCLFAGVPLPPGVATVKKVDWSAVDAASTTPNPAGRGAARQRNVKKAASRRRAAPVARQKPKKKKAKRG